MTTRLCNLEPENRGAWSVHPEQPPLFVEAPVVDKALVVCEGLLILEPFEKAFGPQFLDVRQGAFKAFVKEVEVRHVE